jgi:DNA-binding MarR family transcriptional regulator
LEIPAYTPETRPGSRGGCMIGRRSSNVGAKQVEMMMSMMATAAPPTPEDIRGVTLGLRHLILSGEHFRELRARELALGPSDVMALGHLYHHGPMTPRELGQKMGMTSGTITALLDRVEKAGFLTRANNPADRRSLLINTTPAGRHAMEWLYEQFDEVIRNALTGNTGLASGEVESFLELLGNALDAGIRAEPRSTTVRTNQNPSHPLRGPHGI